MKTQTEYLFAPVAAGHKLNFYGYAVAPEISAIRRQADQIVQTYQEYVPGSQAAVNYLLAISNECRELIKRLLLAPARRERYTIEFFNGTSRAMEVALARTGRPERIILSPFEHPSVIDVARWYAAIAGSKVHQIHFGPEDYFTDWKDWESKLVDEIVREVNCETRSSVLILSEVSYATGLIIPIEPLIKSVRQQCRNRSLSIIIDGAHATGNDHALRALDEWYSYVFSAHKWLLAPEPCGVILSQRAVPQALIPYDAWSNALPSTTANVHLIAGLLSSLRLLEKLGFAALWAHSRELRKLFLERIGSKFMAVGENNGMETTLMLAICPKLGKRWKYGFQELRQYLQKNAVHVLVLSIDPDTPWIRVAFPCFLEVQHMNVLCDVLEGTIAS